MVEPQELKQFYDDCYRPAEDPADGALYAGWRRLSAVTKADHVVRLCARAGIRPRSFADVGCMWGVDGEYAFGEDRHGFEISETAVPLARNQPGVTAAALFDGQRLPVDDDRFDLAIVSHVLEHVPDPVAMLRECARAARTVVLEVPLEANVSARRASKRAHATEIGHLHRFDRRAVRRAAHRAGLAVRQELADPLPRSVHTYLARTDAQRAAGSAKWALRRGLMLVPAVGERLITVHYAALVVRR